MKDISSATTWTSFLQNVLGLIYAILFQLSIQQGRVVSFCFNGTLNHIFYYYMVVTTFKQKYKSRYLAIYLLYLFCSIFHFMITSGFDLKCKM